jgi:predicted transcriptional regulator
MAKEYIEVTLKDICEELEITPHELATESKVRPGTVYDMYNGVAKRVSLDKLATIIKTLNRIAKKQGFKRVYNVSDLLTYKNK